MRPESEEQPDASRAGWLVRHLSRRTSSGRFIPEVDGLRFFSIAMVVLCHIGQNLLTTADAAHGYRGAVRYMTLGRFGPHLFFVISGFVLALPFAEQRIAGGRTVRLRRYYLRRVTRIEPPYLFAMTLLFVAFTVLRGHDWRGLLPHYAAGLVYSHLAIFHMNNPLIPISWSLEVEVQFYLIAPLLAAAFMLRNRRLRLFGLAALGAAAILFRHLVHPTITTLLDYLELFIAGIVVAEIYVGRWRGAPLLNRWWDAVAGFSIAALVAVWLHPASIVSEIAFPIAAGALFCAALCGPILRPIVRLPLLTVIGGMCYTIYLLHFAVITNVGRWLLPRIAALPIGAQFAVDAAIQIPIILAICTTAFLLIERPCMREDWPRRLAAWLRSASRAAALPVAGDGS